MKLIRHAQYTHGERCELTIDEDLRDSLAAVFGDDLTVEDVHYVFELMHAGLVGWGDSGYDTADDLLRLIGPDYFAIVEQEHPFLLSETDHNYIVFFGILDRVDDWMWEEMEEIGESTTMEWYSDECDTSDEVADTEEEIIEE